MNISLSGFRFFMLGRYGSLLLTLVVLMLLQPTVDTLVGKYLIEVLFIVSLFAGLQAIEIKKSLLRFEVMLLLASLLLTFLGILVDHSGLYVIGIAGRALFLSLVALTILLDLFRARRVSGDTLAGAVCVYLLIGLICAFCFIVVEFMVPGSFSFTQGAARLQLWLSQDFYPFFYFGMMTMTTVGYGDMTPLSTVARTIASVEAISGQVYLTILVARLVGMYLLHENQKEE